MISVMNLENIIYEVLNSVKINTEYYIPTFIYKSLNIL
jgi:hypothetical protein